MEASTLLERNHYLIIPSDPVQRTVTEKVEAASRQKLISEYHIRTNPGYTTTVACVYVEACIKSLIELMRENHGAAEINFLDLFSISSTNRENDDADKDGNINIRFMPGAICASIMERDFAPIIDPRMWTGSYISHIESVCATILANKHKMTTNDKTTWTRIAFVYIEYLFRTLKLMAQVGKENGQNSAMINFLEMFEAHITVEQTPLPENPDIVSERFDVKLRPGFQAKLLIKDDGVTEIGDDED